MDQKALAAHLDFANHHPGATPKQIKVLCRQVKQYGFHAAFVNPCYVPLAKKELAEGVVGTVVSFPLGQDAKDVKVLAAIKCARDGADEIDVSANVGWLKAGQRSLVLEEMRAVVLAAKEIRKAVLVKFIIETGLLTAKEIQTASQLVLQSGADFVKTNSGWGPRGASLEDVDLIKKAIGNQLKIKVAGGIGTAEKAKAFIKRGAARIGTSRAVKIVRGASK